MVDEYAVIRKSDGIIISEDPHSSIKLAAEEAADDSDGDDDEEYTIVKLVPIKKIKKAFTVIDVATGKATEYKPGSKFY